MGSPTELGLDSKTNGYSMTLNSFRDEFQQTQKLKEFLDRLEEERLKIDAFKRELPLCMQLLNNAVEASREQLETYQANQGTRPSVLEEFIPLKQSNIELSDHKASSISEKTSWMTTAQLWSQANDGSKSCKAAKASSLDETEQGFSVTPKLSLDNKERNGGAFLPFSRERINVCANPPELALASGNKEIDQEKKCLGPPENEVSNSGRSDNCIKGEKGKGTANATEGQATSTQPQRKARRCWSPELHRRFVNALQMLGGSQVATPKQIRELMKVDGLTNDEVKSHLQKYRLHTRRPGPTAPSPATQAPHLVVLGGIWVPPEYAAAHGAIYGAHPPSAHYCTQPVPQDFYPGPAHQHYSHYDKASSRTHSSPESDNRKAGERSESMEEVEEEGEGKSESGSWRGRGKEEGMVARGLLSLKDGGEDEGESHGSGITLKF